MTPAFDFTSFFITQVSDDTARQTAQAHGCPIIGFDYSDDSMNVLGAFIRVGVPWWHAYRFLNWSKPLDPQIDSVVRGIHRAYTEFHLPLPRFLWIDVEEEFANTAPAVDVRTALHHVMDLLDAYQIGARYQVKAGLYTGEWFYEKYGLLNYTEPADRGLALWCTSNNPNPDQAPMFAGWKQAEGVQYAWNQSVPIGTVDFNNFRDSSPVPPTPPVPPSPNPKVTDAILHIEEALADLKGIAA